MFWFYLLLKIVMFQISPELNLLFVVSYMLPVWFLFAIRDIVRNLVPRRYRKKKDISGQTVLITGAGSGIGRELAKEFSKLSTRLVLVDLNEKSLVETEKLLEQPSETFLYQCDVSKRGKVYEVAKMIKSQVGKVDILVNNAGIVNGKMILDLSDEEILKTIEINTLAHFWLLKAFLPGMMETNKGHIVSMSSQAGLFGFVNLTDYCASKFAAAGLMEALEVELEAKELDGVKTTIVYPSLVNTGLFAGAVNPIGTLLKPEVVAQEIIHGVLENKTIVLIPDWTKYFIASKWIAPTQAFRLFLKQAGLRTWMSNFKGRKVESSKGTTVPKIDISEENATFRNRNLSSYQPD